MKKSTKKTSFLFEDISNLPFIPKLKHHSYVLVAAGVILIVTGFVIEARESVHKRMEYRFAMNRILFNNNLSKYSPADVVDTLDYIDANGMRSGTITVFDKGNRSGTCGYGTNNPCAFYWNVSEHTGDKSLTPHLLLLRSFEENTYSSMNLVDPSKFEIITQGGEGDCKNTTTYDVKIMGTVGWITGKTVEIACYNSKGKVYSSESYSTTTIDKVR